MVERLANVRNDSSALFHHGLERRFIWSARKWQSIGRRALIGTRRNPIQERQLHSIARCLTPDPGEIRRPVDNTPGHDWTLRAKAFLLDEHLNVLCGLAMFQKELLVQRRHRLLHPLHEFRVHRRPLRVDSEPKPVEHITRAHESQFHRSEHGCHESPIVGQPPGFIGHRSKCRDQERAEGPI
jgi:hypothetical protein